MREKYLGHSILRQCIIVGTKQGRQMFDLPPGREVAMGGRIWWGFHEGRGSEAEGPLLLQSRHDPAQFWSKSTSGQDNRAKDAASSPSQTSWPRDKNGFPGAIALRLEYELFRANESYCIVSGIWCQRRDCFRMKPFYKNCLFGEIFMFNFCTKIISEGWLTSNLQGVHRRG